jgi:hypothetical protein
VDESHVWCFLSKGFKRQSNERADVATLGEHRDLPSLEVARVNWALFAPSEYGDDATKGSGLLEEWQKVEDESSTAIGYQGCSEVEAFCSLCILWSVNLFRLLQKILRKS